jgi:hypothetical protein
LRSKLRQRAYLGQPAGLPALVSFATQSSTAVYARKLPRFCPTRLLAAPFWARGEQRDGVDPNLSGPTDCRSGNSIQGLALRAADGYADHAAPRGNVAKVLAILVEHLNTVGR